MVRVLLPFRGVAVLLLAASTVVGQTPEPPAELPLDSPSPGSVDFLRQFSAERNHPLLSLMVDGELTSFDAALAQETSPRLKPAPQKQSASSATETTDACPVEVECPTMPVCLPFCPPPPPPPCHCRKCQRRQRHAHCGNNGPGYGNPYLGWPCAMGGYPGCYGAQPYPSQQCCGRRGHHRQGCGYNASGYQGYGNFSGGGWGGGWNTMGGGGFLDGGCCGACTPYIAPPPPPPQCHCRKCQRKHGCGNQGWGGSYGGYGGYGSGYGGGYGGWGMGSGGFLDGGFGGGCCAPYMPPPPQPQCHCRRCQRKHGCSSGYGYAGSGYPGWPNYPVPGANMVDGGYNGFADPNCFSCGKQHGHGLFHRCRSGHHTQPYPYYAYPRMMPCMQMESFCADCGSGGEFLPSN